jgi:hypothetical protein
MENHSKRLSNVSVGMGGTLIITIFVVLSLTIFATLSFTTAHSDLKLAVKTEKITSDYYETSSKAEKMLSEVYSAMMESRDNINAESAADGSKLYFDTLSKKLSGLKDVYYILEEEKFSVYYESLGEMNQKICIGLDIFYNQSSNEPYYEITSWNLTNIELPVYEEENFDLWEGIEIK